MNDLELCAWTLFVDVVKKTELVENLLKSLQNIGTNLSINVHFSHNHQDKFLNNCNDVSDKEGEWFYPDIKTMEERYHE